MKSLFSGAPWLLGDSKIFCASIATWLALSSHNTCPQGSGRMLTMTLLADAHSRLGAWEAGGPTHPVNLITRKTGGLTKTRVPRTPIAPNDRRSTRQQKEHWGCCKWVDIHGPDFWIVDRSFAQHDVSQARCLRIHLRAVVSRLAQPSDNPPPRLLPSRFLMCSSRIIGSGSSCMHVLVQPQSSFPLHVLPLYTLFQFLSYLRDLYL